jgi:hypothetical protein
MPAPNGTTAGPHVSVTVVECVLADGTSHVARIDGRDRRAYERTRVETGSPAWDRDTEAGVFELVLTRLAWLALTRTGDYSAPFEVFDSELIGFGDLREETVDPTQPASAG